MKRSSKIPDVVICYLCKKPIDTDDDNKVYLNDWLCALPKCERCHKEVCGACMVTCYDCHNDPDMTTTDKYPFICYQCYLDESIEDDDKTVEYINEVPCKNYLVAAECDSSNEHIWYSCLRPHYDETVEDKIANGAKCGECQANENYDTNMS